MSRTLNKDTKTMLNLLKEGRTDDHTARQNRSQEPIRDEYKITCNNSLHLNE